MVIISLACFNLLSRSVVRTPKSVATRLKAPHETVNCPVDGRHHGAVSPLELALFLLYYGIFQPMQLQLDRNRRMPMEISTEFIKLDSFLKAVNMVGSGGEAKMLIADGQVLVNGEVELRRGRKLRPGDRVEVAGHCYRVEEEGNQ